MNTQIINIAEIASKVESMANDVRNGYPSQYCIITINEDTDDEEDVTIRVADHNANPARVSGRTIFFIVESNREGSHISKKEFTPIAGRIYLDESNCDSNGYDIESILDNELN